MTDRLKVPAIGQDTEWGELMGLSKKLERDSKLMGFLCDEEKEDTIYDKGVDLKGKYRALISS